MSHPPITVNGQPFFGRVEEQKQFRITLDELLNTPPNETLPFILLLYGDGGIGKTTLSRRFLDIVRGEYRDQFQTLWIDWEDERRRAPRLQIGREHIGSGELFDSLYAIALRQGWNQQFARYQDALKQRSEAEQKAAEALSTTGEKDDLADLRGTSATVIAKLVRLAAPIVGDAGENVVRAFADAGIKGGAEGLARVRAAATNRLKARLDPDKLDMFFYPDERLAAALAEGFRAIAERQPLIVFLDTYEIVDRADHLLRMVMQGAGPRLLWVIAGRDNLLRSRRFGDEHFKGYAEEFPRRLLPYDMRQLAREDIRSYFAAYVPDRPLDDQDLAAISRATRGIPLAVREAADIWKTGQSLDELVGDIDDDTPGEQIVRRMTERYQLHCLNDEDDSRALYALALARGNVELVRAMLRPDGNASWSLDPTLRRLERDYASVHRERARLHDDPAAFFLEYLKAPVRRGEPWVQQYAQRAVDALQARLEKMSVDLPLIEERCEDEDWVKAALDLADYLFWLDENRAWRWLLPRFVESLVYSQELRGGLVKVADTWKRWLSKGGRKRLKLLGSGAASLWLLSADESQSELLDELTRLERLGWFDGADATERHAILFLCRGRLCFQRKQYAEALRLYEQAEQGLPEQGLTLRQRLGEALNGLARELIWPEGAASSVFSPEAERILPKVVEWLPENQSAWYQLGVVLDDAGKLDRATAAYQQAIALDPKHAYSYIGLGIIYTTLGRTEEAIAAYQQALALDPKYAAPHIGLGNVYNNLGRTEEAIAAYQQAITLDPTFAAPYYHLAKIYMLQRQFNHAQHHFQERIRLNPNTAFSAFVSLGTIARHRGSAESDGFFQQALTLWDTTWRMRLQSPAALLEMKAIALLCAGQRGAALETLGAALTQRLPGDTFELERYQLLAEAPEPPDGIDEMIAMVRQAGGEMPEA